jgi:HPt (histidine-containing phosphotransfer) domain-containing protein
MIDSSNYKHINLEYISEMADGDTDFLADIITNCLESIGPNIDTLAEVAKARDAQAILFQAHKLKGSFRFIGNEEPAVVLEKIEHAAKAEQVDGVQDMVAEVAAFYSKSEPELRDVLKQIS